MTINADYTPQLSFFDSKSLIITFKYNYSKKFFCFIKS